VPPDIVLVICDTARADAFNPWGAPYRSPVLERLCREGVIYRNATAAAPWTLPSTASILSGVLPSEHGATGECFEWENRRPTSPAGAIRGFAGQWLPEALRERGYRTWGASCNTWVSKWGGFDRGFEQFLDLRQWSRPRSRLGRVVYRARKGLGMVDRGGSEAVQRFGQRLASAGPEPLFALVNLMEMHAPLSPPRPYYPFPPWRRIGTRTLAGGPQLALNMGVRTASPKYVRTLRELYQSCARYEDHLLGSFVRAVEERGRPTVLVMVADHGEHLGEHGLFNHNSSLRQTLLHVPLAVWGHRIDLGPAEIEDAVSLLKLPGWLVGLADGDGTVLSANGAVVSEYEGTIQHCGLPDDIAEGIKHVDPSHLPSLAFHGGVAVRRGPFKYVAISNGDEALYELEADPREERNILGERPDAASPFHPYRDQWLERRAHRPEYGAGDLAAGQIAEHLRELGYIE
jgi:arylsulfatase A-like enzyme